MKSLFLIIYLFSLPAMAWDNNRLYGGNIIHEYDIDRSTRVIEFIPKGNENLYCIAVKSKYSVDASCFPAYEEYKSKRD